MTNRRNLIRGLTVAGTASVVWKKPVVDAVMLPAHAMTSGFSETQSGTVTIGSQAFFFDFNVSGVTPTGDATVTVQTSGDIDFGSNETFRIELDGILLGNTSNGGQCDIASVTDVFDAHWPLYLLPLIWGISI